MLLIRYIAQRTFFSFFNSASWTFLSFLLEGMSMTQCIFYHLIMQLWMKTTSHSQIIFLLVVSFFPSAIFYLLFAYPILLNLDQDFTGRFFSSISQSGLDFFCEASAILEKISSCLNLAARSVQICLRASQYTCSKSSIEKRLFLAFVGGEILTFKIIICHIYCIYLITCQGYDKLPWRKLSCAA
jgi:hypothetical protein